MVDHLTEDQVAKAAAENGKQSAGVVPGYDRPNGESYWPETGLTKRELFAAMAMQGALGGTPGRHLCAGVLARDSVAHADALLKELAK